MSDDDAEPPAEADDALPDFARIGAPQHDREERRTRSRAEDAGRVERSAARVFHHRAII